MAGMEPYSLGWYPNPDCSCGRRMLLLRAGYKAHNAGRYYYKCPTFENHLNGFFWFDEFQLHARGNVYSSLNQGSSSQQNTYIEQTATSSVGRVAPPVIEGMQGSASVTATTDSHSYVRIGSICVFVLGMLFGKLL
ncbi:uncharacterized protein LOC131000240 [Salvia miltiorrhiza]|uniref:uncharacterized protein LOC131000240 n=1 Tax=Salvia miltiorrhiza TaxID=226208 RepID=UPI0025AC8587|nr:uncharacterized protein LOC131000240 [Salvia miltiorrhiza]